MAGVFDALFALVDHEMTEKLLDGCLQSNGVSIPAAVNALNLLMYVRGNYSATRSTHIFF